MLVSIGIPVYSGGSLTRAAIASVLSQSDAPPLEVIVIDDGSPEPQQPILEDLIAHPSVRFWRHKRRQGAASTWNELVATSRGAFVKILPQDDLLLPGALATQTRSLQESDAVLVAARSRILTRRGQALGPALGLKNLVGVQDRSAVAREIFRTGGNPLGSPGGILMRTAIARNVRYEESNRYVLDLAHSMDLLRFGSMIGLSSSHVGFRVTRGAWTWRLRDEQLQDFMKLIDELDPEQYAGSKTSKTRHEIMSTARRRTIARLALYAIVG